MSYKLIGKTDFASLKKGTIYSCPIDIINRTGLRVRAVKKESKFYLELLEDIRQFGVKAPIQCYIENEMLFVHNGNHRIEACIDLAIQYINTEIVDKPKTDLQTAREQVSYNISNKSTLAEMKPYIDLAFKSGESVENIARDTGFSTKSIYEAIKLKMNESIVSSAIAENVPMTTVTILSKEIPFINALGEKGRDELIKMSRITDSKTFGDIMKKRKSAYNLLLKQENEGKPVGKPVITYSINMDRLEAFKKSVETIGEDHPYFSLWSYLVGLSEIM